ncbi:Prevent host death protein, Phd antitoxin [Janthinobacterium sp. CG23_2]|nr:Prevent host death protein, Phd antitoxin [Janthinobacterium sp. CG23_2]CUU29261.1 Prevent host death protein, Phd antitoxin [Janthinobacterium sp. CG23_2]
MFRKTWEKCMTTDTIDHTTLIKLAEAGVVRSAHAVGQAGGWGILVKYGMTERALAAQRSQQVRIFRKLETLVEYLKGVGIARFDVDAVNYDPRSITATRRPDRAAAMKDAHAAAAYTKWLKAEVQEALDDTSPTTPHDEAMRQVRAAIKLA